MSSHHLPHVVTCIPGVVQQNVPVSQRTKHLFWMETERTKHVVKSIRIVQENVKFLHLKQVLFLVRNRKGKK